MWNVKEIVPAEIWIWSVNVVLNWTILVAQQTAADGTSTTDNVVWADDRRQEHSRKLSEVSPVLFKSLAGNIFRDCFCRTRRLTSWFLCQAGWWSRWFPYNPSPTLPTCGSIGPWHRRRCQEATSSICHERDLCRNLLKHLYKLHVLLKCDCTVARHCFGLRAH